MFRIFLLYSLIFLSHESVLKNVSLPPIEYASYNSTNEPLQIDCAEQWVMDMPGFTAMEKTWRKDHLVNFNAMDIAFRDNNESIQFSPLLLDDSGNYACCLRNAGETEYYCTARNLTVIEIDNESTAILDSSMNTTTDALVDHPESTNGTVWNVRLGINETLDAQDNHTYFLMLFNGNATVYCTLNGETPLVETTKRNISDPSLPTDYDVVIRSFNATVHSGNYFCNGTYMNGNETETDEVYFSITGSELPNICGNCTGINTHHENSAMKRLAHLLSFVTVFVMM